MLRILRYFLVLSVILNLCGCTKSDTIGNLQDASLQLRISVPDYGVGVKSISSEPASPQNWTSWERAVDGRYLYRVTAFVLKGNSLVAAKDLTLTGEQTQASLDFDSNLTHGSYTLMVVANYSAFQANDGADGIKTYSGLQGFTNTVEQILSAGSIENFTGTYSDSFLNYKISSQGGVCAPVPQPLTLVKEIELRPGSNTISAELLRTYSRIRISVENNSDEILKVTSLDFCNKFTQNSAWLFNSNGYLQERTSPDPTSTNALTPFTGSNSEPVTVEPLGTAVIYDAYILESKSAQGEEGYSYTLGMGYGNSSPYTLASATAITSGDTDISNGYYLIRNKVGNFLTNGESNVTSSNSLGELSTGMGIPEKYVWSFEKTTSNYRYLKTADGSLYMGVPTNSSVPFETPVTVTYYKNNSFYFSNKGSYFTISSNSGSYAYLTVDNGNVRGNSSISSDMQHFVFYSVNATDGSAGVGKTVKIPVNTIDNATGQPVAATGINRNDFINAIVKVSYSNNQGHFTYEVKDWQTGGGNISFN